MIPYGKQDIIYEDIEAVTSVLKSDFLTQGPCVPSFESNLAKYCRVDYAVAVNSATSALHIACMALNLGPGDILWTSSITFVASANCALYCGASVDFVDIDPETFNIDIEVLELKLLQAEKEGTLPKILVPVHLCGQPCNMKRIYELAQKFNFKIIEDASHAIGSMYKDLPTGSCEYSDICVFSFHPVKIITSGEGGAALTKNEELAQKMISLRTHGITNSPEKMHERPEDELWNYQQVMLGFNYRMTDLQAALVNNQLKRLDSYVQSRNILAEKYKAAFTELPLFSQKTQDDILSSYHIYVVRLDVRNINITNKDLYLSLNKAGIGANLHYIPVYKHPYYETLGFKSGYCPEAESYYKNAITLPLYPSLESSDHDYVIKFLRNLFR